MSLNAANLKAILKNAEIKKRILGRLKKSESDFLSFDAIPLSDREAILRMTITILQDGSADYKIGFPNPINSVDQEIDPYKIYGIKGFHVVVDCEREKDFVFSQKKAALAFGLKSYKEFLLVKNFKRESWMSPYEQ
jgi:hypothetical protein